MYKRVLVAEDNHESRQTFGHYLRLAGHSFVLASDGQAAWELLNRGGKFDHIISDYQMPGMDGLELLRRVRAGGRIADTPFTLMSGAMTVSREDQTPLAEACAKFGATFVEKPLDFEALIVRLLGVSREIDDS